MTFEVSYLQLNKLRFEDIEVYYKKIMRDYCNFNIFLPLIGLFYFLINSSLGLEVW